jgi:hypothetical protein
MDGRDSGASASVPEVSPPVVNPFLRQLSSHRDNGQPSMPVVTAPPRQQAAPYGRGGSASQTPTSSTGATVASAPSMPMRSPRKLLFKSTSTVSIPPLMDADGSVAVAEDNGVHDVDLDSMRALFRVDASVFANPDNIAPSLQTSIIMGESQIVGANGILGSLYPGKRRQRRATDAITLEAAAGLHSIQSSHQSLPSLQDHYGIHRQQQLLRTADTAASGHGDGPHALDVDRFTGGSDDMSGRETSVSDTKPISYWPWLCCCWPRHPPTPVESRESMTLTQFTKSLWQRLHMTWDSYFLFFTLALAICSIPLATSLAVALKTANSVALRARCEFREGNDKLRQREISTAMLASIIIPMMNHIVLLFVSLWIAIRCSYSRKRVLRCSPSSMNTTLSTCAPMHSLFRCLD